MLAKNVHSGYVINSHYSVKWSFRWSNHFMYHLHFGGCPILLVLQPSPLLRRWRYERCGTIVRLILIERIYAYREISPTFQATQRSSTCLRASMTHRFQLEMPVTAFLFWLSLASVAAAVTTVCMAAVIDWHGCVLLFNLVAAVPPTPVFWRCADSCRSILKNCKSLKNRLGERKRN